jgi:hypothetical protein
MEEQALYKAIAPDLEHTDEGHARDIIRAVLLARDRELARELRLHPNATINPALARAVRDARFRRRPAVIPVASGSA